MGLPWANRNRQQQENDPVDEVEYQEPEQQEADNEVSEEQQERDWMTRAVESDPEFREQVKRAIFNKQGSQPEQQQPKPVETEVDPLEALSNEVDELQRYYENTDVQALINMDEALVKAGRHNEATNYQTYIDKQKKLISKGNQLQVMLARNEVQQKKTRQAQEQAREQVKQAEPAVRKLLSEFAKEEPTFKDPDTQAAFLQHIDNYQLNAQARLNPVIMRELMQSFAYQRMMKGEKGSGNNQNLPPAGAVKEAHEGGYDPAKAREAGKRKMTKQDQEYVNFFNLDGEKYAETVAGEERGDRALITGVYTPNMTMTKKRSMRP